MDTKSIFTTPRTAGRLGAALLLLGSIAFAGCGGGGGSNFTREEGIFITPNGGVVAFPTLPGFATSTAPFAQLNTQPGVVSSGVKVSIAVPTSPPATVPSYLTSVSGAAYQFTLTPVTADLNSPVTITLAYPVPTNGDPNTFHIFTYDQNSKTWTALGGNFVNNTTVATAYPFDATIKTVPAHTVTARIAGSPTVSGHFSDSDGKNSYYAILGETTPLPPTGLVHPSPVTSTFPLSSVSRTITRH